MRKSAALGRVVEPIAVMQGHDRQWLDVGRFQGQDVDAIGEQPGREKSAEQSMELGLSEANLLLEIALL